MKSEQQGFARSHDGLKLNYVYYPAETKNPTIILSNGVGCIETYWVYLVKHFRGRYPVITWDYRGHGKSQPPEDPTTATMENHARDAKAVLDHIGIEKAVHMGFSMGVQTGFEFYRQFPENTHGLVAVCGPYKHPYDEFFHSELLGTALEQIIDKVGMRTHWLMKPPLKLLMKTPIPFELAKIIQVDRRTMKKDMQSYFEHWTYIHWPTGLQSLIEMNKNSAEDLLPNIKVPVLIVAGEKDSMTSLKHNREMHKLIPNSELTVIRHGSHAAPIEQPMLINYRIELFLKEKFPYDPSQDELYEESKIYPLK